MDKRKLDSFIWLTLVMFFSVMAVSAYILVDPNKLAASVLGQNVDESENLAIEKSYNYKKVEVLDKTVEGGTVTFKVEDQGIGYIDRYVARCENREDPTDVRDAKYSIPLVQVYGLLEGAKYKCTVAIERDGKLFGRSRVIGVQTDESSYEKVESLTTESSFDSITLEAKNQYIDYRDLYFAKCFDRGTREMVETAGVGGYEGENEDTQIVIGGLSQNREYDCYMAVKKSDGTLVAESDLILVKTKIGMTNIAAGDTNVTLEVEDQRISGDDFYFAQCMMKSDEKVTQKAFANKPKLVVEGLTPETEYSCFVGVDGVGGEKTKTNDVIVKTLENPYGKVEIASTLVEPTMIEFELKDLMLSYRDFYVVKCENTQNRDLVYVANSKYPKIRVRDLLSSQEYECTASVEMPTRTVGTSDSITLKTPELEFPFGQ